MAERDTSEASAARALEARRRKLAARPYRRRNYQRRRPIEAVLGAGAAEALRHPDPPPPPRRIACDFSEPTLRLIHDVLCDRIGAGDMVLDQLNLLLIAEQMVAIALGIPPCDDPPLTDRRIG